jgi:predicted nucleic acid-binding protein
VIILDTNVLSALMSSEPDPDVVAWLDQQAPESVWTTSITVFEIRFGLALMDAGMRQRRLTAAFETLLAEDLSGRVLNFDSVAAARTATLIAGLRRTGRSIEIRDGMICGIALARRASIATRNVRHFEPTPASIINPWA